MSLEIEQAPICRAWFPRAAANLPTSMTSIISLYAGAMTVRDIEHHLATTIGVNVSPDTMSAVTDAV